MAEPVILSEEPKQIKIDIDDPMKPKAIVKGAKKIPRKPKWGDKLIAAFFGSDVNSENLGEHIIKDYAEPTGKKILNNVAQGVLKRLGDGVQILLFGKIVENRNGPVDYTSFSNPNNAGPVAHKLAERVEQFSFNTAQDARKVLEYLKGLIDTYGSASVMNYYEAVNEPVDFMMANKGWTNLNAATVKDTPEGFIIDMPRPIMLKRG